MSSGEAVSWSEPRACRPLGIVRGPARPLLGLHIDPPVIGQPYGLGGEDIHEIVVTPVNPRHSVDPLTLPTDVHVLLLDRPFDPAEGELGSGDLRNIARARLLRTRGEAEALDASMQRMNGPRR
jgi:hypothetical protein